MKQKRTPFGIRRRWAFFIALLIAVIVALSGLLVWQSRQPTVADELCLMAGVDRDDESWAQCVADYGFISKAMQSGMSSDDALALLMDSIAETAEAELQAELEQMSPEERLEHLKQMARDSQRSQQEMTATPAAKR